MSSRDIEFLVHFICESDAIENISDNPTLVNAQIRRGARRGHVGAMLFLSEGAAHKTPLTDAIVKRIQSLIVTEQHMKGERAIAKKYRGNWRDCDVWIVKRVDGLIVEKIKMVPPTCIPSLMRGLIKKVVRWQARCAGLSNTKNVASIARFHYDYLRIHPFVDGNGRSGRALAYYLYRCAGLTPFVFTANDRHETYYRCFNDPADMQEYFRKRTV